MNKKFFTTLAFYVTVAAIATIVLFPFLWMLASSFKTQVDIIAWPPKFIFEPTLQNYLKVFEEQDFLKYFINSTIVGGLAVGLSLLLGLPAAYSISRYAQKRLAVFILLRAVFNLKLPMKKRWQETRLCLDLFAQQAQKPLTIRAKQLYHDREEITVFVTPTR